MSETSTSRPPKGFSLFHKPIKWVVNRPRFLSSLRGRLILSFTGIVLLVIMIGGFSVRLRLGSLQADALREAELAAKIIAVAVARNDESQQIPPLYENQQSLQDLVEDLHRLEGRDIEVIDLNRKIIADVFPEDAGKLFEHDVNNEVGQTLKDGMTRTFIEMNADYPKGIRQLVVPLRRENTGEIIGVILFEYTPLYENLLTSVRNSIQTILIAIFICVALATVIGHQTSKSISVPLTILRDATTRIKQGDLETKIGIDQEDEIGELASALRAMSKDLKETIQTLQIEVLERKEAEEAVKQSEKRFRALIENSADGITLLDANGISIYDSPAAPGMLGYEPGELIGQNVFERVHPGDLPEVIGLFQSVVQSFGSRAGVIFRFRHKDGSWLWLEAVATNLLDEPAIKAIVVNYRNITDRKTAEEALQQAKDYAESVIQTANVIFLQLDIQGHIWKLNTAAEEITGYKPEELIGRNWFELLVPRDRYPDVWQEFERITTLGEVATIFENPILTKQGEERYVLWKNNVIRESGKVTGTISFGIDITERKQAEETLRASEDRYRDLVDNSQDLICTHDLEGHILSVNPHAEQSLGYPPGALLTMNIRDILMPGKEKYFDRYITKIQKYGIDTGIMAVQTTRGESRIWEYRNTLRTDGVSSPIVRGMARDVTEQKRAEEAMREGEERFRTLIEQSSEGITLVGEEGNILEWNQAMEQITGIPRAQAVRLPVWELQLQMIPSELRAPQSADSIKALFSKALQTGNLPQLGKRLEVEIQTMSGEHKTVTQTIFMIKTAGGYRIGSIVLDITEQKRAEEKILSLSRFPDEDPNPVLRLSPVGRILYANKASKPILGLWGQDDNQTLPEEWQRHIAEVFASGLNKEVEIQCAGQIFSCILSPVREEGYINFYGRDITERKQAEEALIQSEDRYRTLFEDSPISIWEEDFSSVKQRMDLLRRQGITDFKTYLSSHPELVTECASLIHIVDVNKAAMDLLQAKRKEDLLINLVEVLDQEGLKRFQDELVCIAEGRSQYDWEGSNQTLTGQRIDIRGSWSVVPGHEVDLSKVVISLIDITERKRAELALREAKNHYRLLVERLPAVTYIISSEAPFSTLYISPQVEQVLGFTPEEWLADPDIWERQIYSEDRERVLAEDIASREENRPFICEYRIFRRDGRLIWLHDETHHIHELGMQPYSQGIEFDVTERKQAEEEIQSRTSELTTLYDLSRALADTDNLDKILEVISRHAVESVHTTFARIVLLEGNKFVTRAMYPVRFLDHDLLIGTREPMTELPFCQQVLEQNEPVILHSNNQEIAPDERAALLLDTVQSLCLVPLRIGGHIPASRQVLGLLILGEERNEKREPFSPDKIRLAQSIGDQAAVAIRRILLHDQTELRLEHLMALREIDQVIASSIGLDLSLSALLSQVTQQLQVDASAVWIFNPVTNMLVYSSGRGFRSKAFEQAKHLRLGEGYAGRVALNRQIIHISNLPEQQDNPRLINALASDRFISYYAVPLIAKGTIKGVLEVFHRTPLEPDQEWLDFLNTLAGQGAIAIDNATMFENLQRSRDELSIAYDETIEGWSRALDLRDKETEGHTQRVTETTVKLARLFGLNEEEIIQIRRGALLHDIGKMGVPDGILLKPGPLTEDEWVIMRQHPRYAFDMLSPIYYLKSALDIPYCHHEKWNGGGYPRGLKGEEIPLVARIFAVVDVWDALTSDRPYRPAWPEKKVLEYIESQAGTHFDPQMVEICLKSGILAGKH